MSDEILAEQLRTAAGGFHRADAFVSLAESLDDMLAGTETGLTATLQAFANALQDVANDPSSTVEPAGAAQRGAQPRRAASTPWISA